MKHLSIFLCLNILFIISACNPEGPNSAPNNPSSDNTIQNGGTILTGIISENLTIPKGNYLLKGTVEVNEGVSLTINAGATFTVLDQYKNLTNVLVVKQGAKIIAQGTANEPIVFTSEIKNAGQWGGLILLGKSTINIQGGTSEAEAGGYKYGGTDANDNSGILSYVRIEYSGSRVANGTSEYNSFSFFGVGAATKLEYLEAYKGADDGFEFFGGTVKANYLIAIDCEDDSFDWDQGYTGGGTEWIAQQNEIGDNGVEASNHPSEFERTPTAKPIITKLTIYRKTPRNGKDAVGILFKDGTGADISDLKIDGIVTGILIGDSTTAQLAVNDMDKIKLNKIALNASGQRVEYKQSNSPQIMNFPPDNDTTAKGASTSWTSAPWIIGYVTP